MSTQTTRPALTQKTSREMSFTCEEKNRKIMTARVTKETKFTFYNLNFSEDFFKLEEATSELAGFFAAPLSWSNWDFSGKLFFTQQAVSFQ